MRKAAFVLGLLGLLSPSALQAEGVAIDHRAVGCIVAGKYPRLNACFAPRPASRAPACTSGSRTLRPTGTTSRWRPTRLVTRASSRDRRRSSSGGGSSTTWTRSTSPSPRAARRRPRRSWWRSESERREEAAGGPVPERARPSPSSRACPPASPAVCRRPRGRGHRRPSRWAAPRSWGAGWLGWSTGRPSDRLRQPPRPSRLGAGPPRRCRRRRPPRPLWLPAFNPVFKVFDGPTLVPGRHVVGTEPLGLPLRHVRIDRQPLPHALRGRGGRRHREETGASPRCPSRPFPTSSVLRGAAVHHSAGARTLCRANDDPVHCPEQRAKGVPATDGDW